VVGRIILTDHALQRVFLGLSGSRSASSMRRLASWSLPVPGGRRARLGRVRHTDLVPLSIVHAWFQQRRRENDQWRQGVDAQHLDSVNQLANLGDAELIASAPGIPNVSHQMEMDRRLKVAIADLTTETIAARKSSDRTAGRLVWLTVVLVVLTAALVALTVVLAVKK
jgi:hypothetical protein